MRSMSWLAFSGFMEDRKQKMQRRFSSVAAVSAADSKELLDLSLEA